MASLKFEGIEQISEIQINFISKVLEERGFNDGKVVMEPVGKAGDNYTANVKRVTYDNGSGTTFKFIAKIAPTNEMMRLGNRASATFGNETLIYTKILPKFEELETKAGLSSEDKLRWPACYGTLNESPNEVILLEDLAEVGFAMLDRFKSLDDVQVKSILRNFAKFHALSYVLKNKEPNVYEEFATGLQDMWGQGSPEAQMFMTMFFNQIETQTLMVLDQDKHKKLVKGLITGAFDQMNKLNKADEGAKQIVIQQGDAWTNNIMYKLTDTSTIPESIMIDYQQARQSNPVCDLLYMIFNCTDYQTRKDHYHGWIDFYHDELDNFLSNFGLKASYIYPKDQLDADLKRYGKVGLILAILLAGVMIANPEDALKVKDALENANPEEVVRMAGVMTSSNAAVAMLKIRIEGVINSLSEFGLISV